MGNARDGLDRTTDDILDAIAQGGYPGIEITDTMIGTYAAPDDFACDSTSAVRAKRETIRGFEA